MSHDDGATIRLVAALVRAYDNGDGHMVISLHPETLREMALAAKREVARLRAERDSRPEITPEDAALLRDWMLSERAEACAEHPTPHWVDRVVDATCAHARKVKP